MHEPNGYYASDDGHNSRDSGISVLNTI